MDVWRVPDQAMAYRTWHTLTLIDVGREDLSAVKNSSVVKKMTAVRELGRAAEPIVTPGGSNLESALLAPDWSSLDELPRPLNIAIIRARAGSNFVMVSVSNFVMVSV